MKANNLRERRETEQTVKDEAREMISEAVNDMRELREIEQLLKQERNNYKVRLRIQMKEEHKTIQELKEEWEEVQQSIIVREMKLQAKYEKMKPNLSEKTRIGMENTQLYAIELIFTVLKQYLKEILEAIDELECQTKS